MLTCCVCAGAWAQTQGMAGSVNVPTVKRSGITDPVNQVIVVKGGERQGVIKIQLTGSSNCRDMQFDLTLPAGITLANAPTGAEVKMVEAKDANHVLFYALNGQTVKIAVVDNVVNHTGETAPSADTYGKYLANGIVFELPIKVASTFEGVQNATIANLAFTDDYATADIKVDDATFTIDALLLGDVTDDGVVDATDAVAIALHDLDATPAVFIEEVGDVIEDGTVDSTDAVRVALDDLAKSSSSKVYTEVEEEDVETEVEPE